MKKSIVTGLFGIAFAFALVACQGNANKSDSNAPAKEGANVEQNDKCMHHCEMTCPDSACLANKCENCQCPEDAACHKKEACKGDGNCHHGDGECCKGHDGEKCNHADGCKKECENKK